MISKCFARLRAWTRTCKCEIHTLVLAAKHPGTPWYAKMWLAGVAAYAISPIDLIPDFIPVLGYLDDLILLPLGIWIGQKMIPTDVMVECQQKAENLACESRRRFGIAAIVILLIWCFVSAAMILLILHGIRA